MLQASFKAINGELEDVIWKSSIDSRTEVVQAFELRTKRKETYNNEDEWPLCYLMHFFFLHYRTAQIFVFFFAFLSLHMTGSDRNRNENLCSESSLVRRKGNITKYLQGTLISCILTISSLYHILSDKEATLKRHAGQCGSVIIVTRIKKTLH